MYKTHCPKKQSTDIKHVCSENLHQAISTLATHIVFCSSCSSYMFFLDLLSNCLKLRAYMYTSTVPGSHALIHLFLLSAAVVSGVLVSSYLCLLSQHVVVYDRQNMPCLHQLHIPPESPQF